MKKAELIDQLVLDTKLPFRSVEAVLNGIAAIAQNRLAGGVEMSLPGIGKLKPTSRPARTGRNPKTGIPMEIPGRQGVKFSAAKALGDTLNP